MAQFHFGLQTTVDDETGALISVYFQIRHGRVKETREFADGLAFADYDASGHLLGIELIGPCSVKVVDQLAANEAVMFRRKTKEFMIRSGPAKFVIAA